MKARLVCDALRMATWQRQPQAGLIVHSDRGSQYASREHRKLLEMHGFEGIMSRTGDCFDNAVAERLFRQPQTGANPLAPLSNQFLSSARCVAVHFYVL